MPRLSGGPGCSERPDIVPRHPVTPPGRRRHAHELDWTRKSTKMRDMKSTRLNMHDAKTHLSRHIAALKGDDRIVICNRNRPVAEVRLLPGARARPRKPGAAKGTFTVPASFFEPLPEDLLAGFEGRG
jgi:antitoxin (DNA-binding transcriptional repressor) of toxin-antitoxin stability system